MDRLKEVFAYFVAAMAMLALLCAVYEAMNQRLGSGGVLVGIFIAGAFILYIQQLDTFKAFGVEAKMQSTLARAEITLNQLQKLAVAFAKANLTQLAMSGQIMSRLNTEYKFELRDKIIATLRDINVSSDDISVAQIEWTGIFCSMLLDSIEVTAAKLLPGVKVVDEIESLPKNAERALPSPDAVRSWITAKSLKDDQLTKLIDAYASVWTTGTMADPSLIPFNQVLRSRSRE